MAITIPYHWITLFQFYHMATNSGLDKRSLCKIYFIINIGQLSESIYLPWIQTTSGQDHQSSLWFHQQHNALKKYYKHTFSNKVHLTCFCIVQWIKHMAMIYLQATDQDVLANSPLSIICTPLSHTALIRGSWLAISVCKVKTNTVS